MHSSFREKCSKNEAIGGKVVSAFRRSALCSAAAEVRLHHFLMCAERAAAVVVLSDSDEEEEDVVCTGDSLSCAPAGRRPGFCRKCGRYLIGVMTFPCFHAALCVSCYNALDDPKRCFTCGAVVTQGEVFVLS